MLSLYFNIFATLCLLVEGKSVEGQKRYLTECEGSLRLVSPCGVSHKFQDNTPHIRFNAAQAVLEGCGCYRLYERKNYRGRSVAVTEGGTHVITLRKVRSISRISCSPPSKTTENIHRVSHVAIFIKVKKVCKNNKYEIHY